MLTVTTWNLGYAGLGYRSDFVIDGGTHWLPPSRREVKRNLAGILAEVTASRADVLLFQEVSRAGLANYWVDVEAALREALPDFHNVFAPDLLSRIQVPPLRVSHGLATYCRPAIRDSLTHPLPSDGDIATGALSKAYIALVNRIEDANGAAWSVINLHLAAFDPGAELRRRQRDAVLALAQGEYALGRHVVVGGDWNMRLVPTDFLHTTPEQYLTWLADFDRASLPDGWTLAADAKVPSVRTNEKPYVPGENYTTVIDGFLISPNVRLVDVRGHDLGFRHSDHQPVTAVLARV